MPLPIYSTNFFAIGGLQGEEFADVVAGTVHIIRDVEVYMGMGSGNSSNFRLIQVTGGNGTMVWFNHEPFENPAHHEWHGRIVMTAGYTWKVHVDGDPADVCVSGYILTAPT